MTHQRLGEVLAEELDARREKQFTGLVTLTVVMKQGGVLDARLGDERRIVVSQT